MFLTNLFLEFNSAQHQVFAQKVSDGTTVTLLPALGKLWVKHTV